MYPSAPAVCYMCGVDYFKPAVRTCAACDSAHKLDLNHGSPWGLRPCDSLPDPQAFPVGRSYDNDTVPTMPLCAWVGQHGEDREPHREHYVTPYDLSPEERLSAIARPVHAAELRAEPAARAKVQEEWDRLRAIDCWRPDEVREFAEVRDEANKARRRIHVVRIAALCVEKGAELPAGHKDRKYKGRCVVLGDRIVDQNRQAATFSELSSNPASIDASKFGDWWACLYSEAHGEHTCMQSDATQAYTQSRLGGPDGDQGPKTWVRLPRDPVSYTHLTLPTNREV